MTTATLTAKGQITIPAEVPKDLKVDAGDRVEFVRIAPGRYELVAATQEVTELKGMFGPVKKTVSIDAMNADIARLGTAARLLDSNQCVGALHHARRCQAVASGAGCIQVLTFDVKASKHAGMTLVA